MWCCNAAWNMLNLPWTPSRIYCIFHTDRCCPRGGAAAPFNLQRSDPAEQKSNRVQPNLHPASSTGTDVSSVQVDGKNAAAGKMAPNTAPLKGEKLTFLTVNVRVVKFYPLAAWNRRLRLRSMRPFPARQKPAFLPCCGQLAGPEPGYTFKLINQRPSKYGAVM